MKVFISSVVTGFEEARDAASAAARLLGHEVKRSEDFPALDASPEQACLAGVRWADVVILILGGTYGSLLASGLSATQEEYQEARDQRAILAFVQHGIDPEPPERAFIEQVRRWQGGRVTGTFSTPEELKDAVTRALHEFELSQRAGDVDPDELLSRAQALIPPSRGFATAELCFIVAPAPRQVVIRPAELEGPDLSREVLREALLGPNAVLDVSAGTQTSVAGNALILEQPDGSVYLDQLGSLRITQPAVEEVRRGYSGLPVLIEEVVAGRLERAMRLAGWLLDRLDAIHRLSAVLPMVAIRGGTYLGWRTREEHAQSPNQVSARISGSDPESVVLDPAVLPRPVLLQSTDRLVEDFVSLLRRTLRA